MKKILGLMVGILLTGANLYAGNGDLIVNGSVGIGTNLPSGKLEVFGQDPTLKITQNPSSPGDTILQISAAGANNLAKIKLGGATFQHSTNSGNPGSLVMQPNGGNVGIGTTTPDPGYKLTVAGSALAFNGIWQNSDIRLKKNILPVEGALDKILKLNGVSYEWKYGRDFEGETSEAFKTDEDGNIKDDNYRNLPEGRRLGVIAQELENVLPEAVNTGEDGVKAVSYTEIIPVLIEAMKEQQKQITDQQKRIEELEKKISQLK